MWQAAGRARYNGTEGAAQLAATYAAHAAYGRAVSARRSSSRRLDVRSQFPGSGRFPRNRSRCRGRCFGSNLVSLRRASASLVLHAPSPQTNRGILRRTYGVRTAYAARCLSAQVDHPPPTTWLAAASEPNSTAPRGHRHQSRARAITSVRRSGRRPGGTHGTAVQRYKPGRRVAARRRALLCCVLLLLGQRGSSERAADRADRRPAPTLRILLAPQVVVDQPSPRAREPGYRDAPECNDMSAISARCAPRRRETFLRGT